MSTLTNDELEFIILELEADSMRLEKSDSEVDRDAAKKINRITDKLRKELIE